MKATLISSQKGGHVIELLGYTYTVSRANPTSISWRCTQRQAERCSASVNTTLHFVLTRAPTAHSHQPVVNEVPIRAVRNDLRKAAIVRPEAPPSTLVTEFVPRELAPALSTLQGARKCS